MMPSFSESIDVYVSMNGLHSAAAKWRGKMSTRNHERDAVLCLAAQFTGARQN